MRVFFLAESVKSGKWLFRGPGFGPFFAFLGQIGKFALKPRRKNHGRALFSNSSTPQLRDPPPFYGPAKLNWASNGLKRARKLKKDVFSVFYALQPPDLGGSSGSV